MWALIIKKAEGPKSAQLLLVSVLVCGVLRADDSAVPAWQRENVLLAASQIGLAREQLPQFKTNLFTFIDNYYYMVHKVFRREDFHLDKLARSKGRRLMKKMDLAMAEMMDKKQFLAYENYRNLLRKEMGTQRKGAKIPRIGQADLITNTGG